MHRPRRHTPQPQLLQVPQHQVAQQYFDTAHTTQHNINNLSQYPYTPVTPTSADKFTNVVFADSINPVIADTFDLDIALLDDTSNETELSQFMSSLYDASKPAIRVQSSTPLPQLPSTGYDQSAMSATSLQTNPHPWGFLDYGNNNNTGLQSPSYAHRGQSHNRTTSSSSIASNASASQYGSHATRSTGYPAFGQSDNSPPASSVPKVESSYAADQSSGKFSNHLPTPSQTPKSETFLSPNYQNYSNNQSYADNAMATFPMHNRAFMDASEDDVPGYTHSSRQSVSSFGNNSPATPHTALGDDFDDKYKLPSNDMTRTQQMPKFDDDAIFGDMFTQQPSVSRINTSQPQQRTNNSLLSPFRGGVHPLSERLNAANVARSQSPSNSGSRGVSPFRNGSPHAPVNNNSFGSPRQHLGSVANMREQSRLDAQRFAFKKQAQPNQEEQPKTISPKDAMLDYEEPESDSKMPLFPESSPNDFNMNQQFPASNQFQGYGQGFNQSSQQSFGNVNTGRKDSSWEDTQPLSSSFSGVTSAPPQSAFSFTAPSMPSNLYNLPAYAPVSRPEPTPDFPAHLTSMESSASEATMQTEPPSSQSSEIAKPPGTRAETGTYSCTYHGCAQRFESPQKLQKHKREGHRLNPSNVTSGIGSGMSQADLLARNSQAGPHKCERINPTTGKPCNVVFSRPYDLTRHEDTIHNCRKQKVRCALCVEEKTFSRNDALTRHMRVVHPEVDFPGKHRRRGPNVRD